MRTFAVARLPLCLLLVLFYACSNAATNDLVVLETGQEILGNVQSYQSAQLIIVDQKGISRQFKRADVRSIRLDVDKDPPSYEKTPALPSETDQVFLRNGEIRFESLLTITPRDITTSASHYPRDRVHQIVFGRTSGGAQRPPRDSVAFGDAPERCIEDLEAHLNRTRAYAQAWVAKLKEARSRDADAYAIGARMDPEEALLTQVRRLYEEFNRSLDDYKELLTQQGHASANSEQAYQQFRQTMYNQTLNQCIGAYFIITQAWIAHDLEHGMDLPFWSRVMNIPLTSFAAEQKDILGRPDMNERGFDAEDLARPPHREFIENHKQILDTWTSKECRGSDAAACMKRIHAGYCNAFKQARRRWADKTTQRFNDIAARNYDDVAVKWVFQNLERVLDAREFALIYRKEMHLRDKDQQSGTFQWNEAKQTLEGLNQSYGLTLERVMPNLRRPTLSYVVPFLNDRERWYGNLRETREEQISRQKGSFNENCDDGLAIRLLELDKTELTKLLEEIEKLKPDLDAPVNIQFEPRE